MGLVRNHYVGRTFIEPKQSIRNFGVKVKLNPVRSVVGGKRIVLVDDSIVRGTTSKKLVRLLKSAGATEVHMRISSPPTINPCHYGIDTPRRKELIAATHELEEIRAFIEADSLGYLSLDGMLHAFGKGEGETCAACFSGRYPVPFAVAHEQQAALRRGRRPLRTAGRPAEAADTIAPPRRRPGGSLARRRAIPNDTPLTYAASGVDIDAKMAAVARAKEAIRSTFTPGVVGDVGGFGGLFRPDFGGMEDPLLVASADGVGTKIRVAIAAGVHGTVGQDIVNHCVDDILVQGARPLFFLDYVATGRMRREVIAEVIGGVADGLPRERLRPPRRRDGRDAGDVRRRRLRPRRDDRRRRRPAEAPRRLARGGGRRPPRARLLRPPHERLLPRPDALLRAARSGPARRRPRARVHRRRGAPGGSPELPETAPAARSGRPALRSLAHHRRRLPRQPPARPPRGPSGRRGAGGLGVAGPLPVHSREGERRGGRDAPGLQLRRRDGPLRRPGPRGRGDAPARGGGEKVLPVGRVESGPRGVRFA